MQGDEAKGEHLLRAALAALAASTLTACASAVDDVAWEAPAAVLALPSHPPPAEPELVRVLDLEGTSLVEGQRDRVRIEASNDGVLIRDTAAGNGRRAAKFPARCTQAPAECPRVLVEVADAPQLNPDDRDLRFGATVKVRPNETTHGSNIVQKGFATGKRGQYKLQLDDLRGRPSCVLVGRGSDQAHVALSRTSVADGRWHVVACHRSGDVLTVLVDGEPTGRTTIPLHLWIHNHHPIRIGAKNTKWDNDQFFGTLDAVFVEVERPAF